MLMALLAYSIILPISVQASDQASSIHYKTPAISGLNRADIQNLLTPRAAFENFYFSAKNGDFEQAAKSLHTALVKDDFKKNDIKGKSKSIVLAKMLWPLVNNEIWFDWAALPDLPDGHIDTETVAKGTIVKTIKDIKIDELSLDDRKIPFFLQRFQVEGSDDLVWLFSPRSMVYVPKLYEKYRPPQWERNIPEWGKTQFYKISLWQWLILPFLLLISIGVGIAAQKLISYIYHRGDHSFVNKLLPQLRIPLIIFFGILALRILSDFILSLTGPILTISDALFTISMIVAFMWGLTRVFGYYLDHLQERFSENLDEEKDSEKKAKLTHISVARRVAIFIAMLASIGIIMLQFDLLKGIGTGFLSSAGILSIIMGIAAQSTLGNIVAGLQIAISKPVRIGDTVSYEGTWCYAEDITFTYIVLRVWDDRRIIVPLKKFTSESFENWSMRDSHLLQPIYLYTDYTVDVEKIRKKFSELLQAHENYDEQKEPTVQAYAMTEHALCIRLLCSAKTSGEVWLMHCELREKMNSYLADLENGKYLPRERQENI